MAEEDDQKDHGSTDDRKGPKTERGRRFWLIGGLVVLFVSVGLIYLGYWIFFARFNVGTVAWELTERGPIVDLRLLGHKPLGGFSRESILISCFVTQTSPPSEIASY